MKRYCILLINLYIIVSLSIIDDIFINLFWEVVSC